MRADLRAQLEKAEALPLGRLFAKEVRLTTFAKATVVKKPDAIARR